MLGFLSLLWGGSFFFYKVLAPVLPPATLVLGRVAIAAVALHAVLLLRGQVLRLDRRLLVWFVLLGGLNCALPFCLFAWSEQRLASGLAATLNATTPIMTGLVAHLLTRDERISPRMLGGAVCAFAGVVVLIGRDLFHAVGSANLPGELACLLASLAYAFGGTLSRRLRDVPPLHLATGQITGATIVMLPIAAILDRFWTLPLPPASGWAALCGIALASTALAYLLYFRILASAGATKAALVTFLTPISALALGALFLGEPVGGRAVGGVLLIGAGLCVIDGRLLRAIWRQEEPTGA